MSYDGITSFHQGELRDVENIFGQSQSYGRMSEIWRGKQTIFVWDRRFFDSLLGKVPKEKPFSITLERNLHCCNLRSLGCGWDAGGPGVWGFCWWLAFDGDDETWQVRLSEFNKKSCFACLHWSDFLPFVVRYISFFCRLSRVLYDFENELYGSR